MAGVSALHSQASTLWRPVRLYNVMCWIYGSDPIKYSQLVGGRLSEDRAVRCPRRVGSDGQGVAEVAGGVPALRVVGR